MRTKHATATRWEHYNYPWKRRGPPEFASKRRLKWWGRRQRLQRLAVQKILNRTGIYEALMKAAEDSIFRKIMKPSASSLWGVAGQTFPVYNQSIAGRIDP
ncbi:MAG: hypothetical protein GY851_03270 [bacterium]|nr:hypothetical protein [bacterium]